jgi:hypothetical protein
MIDAHCKAIFPLEVMRYRNDTLLAPSADGPPFAVFAPREARAILSGSVASARRSRRSPRQRSGPISYQRRRTEC